MRVSTVAAFVGVLSLTHAVPSIASRSLDGVPFKLDPSGGIVVPVVINGAGPFRFLLDTGSTRSAVTDRSAARLGLSAVARCANVTAAGRDMRDIVRLTRVTLGTVSVNDLLAIVTPEPELRALAPGLDGVLAQDFLLEFDYTLDYRHRRLVWDDAGLSSEPGDVRLPLRRVQGRWLVELPQDRRPSVWFVPDSGVPGIIIFNGTGPSPLELGPACGRAEVATLSGHRDAALKSLPFFRVGSIVFRDEPAVVIERPEPDAPAGQGLLPLQMFASVSFNAHGSYLVARTRVH